MCLNEQLLSLFKDKQPMVVYADAGHFTVASVDVAVTRNH